MFSPVSIKEKAVFARKLAFLIHAGVPIIDGLTTLKEQTRSVRKRKLFEQVISDVAEGQRLSGSLAKLGGVFDDFAVNLVRIGEESGTLDENLEHLAEELKKKQALRHKVLGALVYPIFVTTATLGIVGMLILYIFPKILPIFASLNVALPLPTRILIAVNAFLLKFWVGLLIGGGLFFVIGVLLLRIPKVRFVLDHVLLKVPLVGKIIQSYQLSNFCRTLAILIRSDVRIMSAFAITADTTSNLVYRKAFTAISDRVSYGEKITAHMRRAPHLFPPMVSHMVAIGEETGNLVETLKYLSEMYEGEVDEFTKNLTTLVEPILMIFMGLIVGIIAISIIAPVYEITQHIQP